jgi:hypothetical protein
MVVVRLASKRYEFLKHEWYASWAPETDEDKRHLSVMSLTHRLKLFGIFLPLMDLRVAATQVRVLFAAMRWLLAYWLPRLGLAWSI